MHPYLKARLTAYMYCHGISMDAALQDLCRYRQMHPVRTKQDVSLALTAMARYRAKLNQNENAH